MATPAQLLASVEKAIDSLLTHKVSEYQIEGVRYRYSDLATLWGMRKDLKRELRPRGRRIRLANLGGMR